MTGTNCEKIIHENLSRLYRDLPRNLAACLSATRKGDRFLFRALDGLADMGEYTSKAILEILEEKD